MWANGMEGGHVHGHDGVRNYWTRPMGDNRPACGAGQLLSRADGATNVEVAPDRARSQRVACCPDKMVAIFSEWRTA